MGLKETIQNDVKTAMKERDADRVSALRMVVSEIKRREIDKRITLEDGEILKLLQTMIKQRQDSIDAFKSGGRDDLVAKETTELNLLQTYLPAQLSREEVEKIVSAVIAELGATGPKDMGKVMPAVLAKVTGKADGKMVSEIVRSKLT